MLDYEGKLDKIKEIYDQINEDAEDIEGAELSGRVIVDEDLLGKVEDMLYLEDADLNEVSSETYKIGEDLSLSKFLGAFVEEIIEMQEEYDIEIDMLKKFNFEVDEIALESIVKLKMKRKEDVNES
ncbi:MAG: hypothetical protein AWU54_1237 [Candidatus Frackibacter sp. T328-2]|nr:MAG: hypothetical protein AWU54_1237 [Candidatus Frackibacter sp. T328-2]